MSSVSCSASLAVTLTHAVAYLTQPLVLRYSAPTIKKLQASLQANLAATYIATWVPTEPLRGSGRRCLTLSPLGHPPRPVYNACQSAQVQWADWMRLLGGIEFDMFIDPGCVSVRFGNWSAGAVSKLVTVWSEELEAIAKAKAQAQVEALIMQQLREEEERASKSLAQMLAEEDEEDDQVIFSMIADEVRAPTWMTPLLEQFPAIPSTGTVRTHSRSSSRSSIISSSGFSFSSQESIDSASSVASSCKTMSSSAFSPSLEVPAHKPSRRERARQARVFVDNSKIEVTPYDGGKTTVLTGGVMLGAPSTSRNGGKAKRF
ncbi:hypothetical protein BD410DRAFT_781355 [Rickenella mellea]|uniref:Anti-proliferative protein domain-containing protein n=1 Tax=Rickenella mellea TaxID=50990 RepID=A0A4Y7QNI5_9AGAM|nr:hypothetical protein BD410DRAFT_781355 [Rickenella mellea]